MASKEGRGKKGEEEGRGKKKGEKKRHSFLLPILARSEKGRKEDLKKIREEEKKR